MPSRPARIDIAGDLLRHDNLSTKKDRMSTGRCVGPGGFLRRLRSARIPRRRKSCRRTGRGAGWPSPNGKAQVRRKPADTALPPAGYPSTGELYSEATASWRAAFSAVRAAGDTPVAGGLIWHQGESDRGDAPGQADRLIAVIQDLQKTCPAGPILVAKLYRPSWILIGTRE